MKKLISLILSLCLVCMLIPAMADADVTGVWYMHTMKQGDVEMEASAIGMNVTLTLNADGTGTMAMMGQGSDATWTLDGDKITVTVADSPAVEGTFDGTTITLTQETESGVASMAFTREEVKAVELAPVKTTATAEEFEGEWTCAYVDVAGMIIDAQTAYAAAAASGTETGSLPVLKIENGKMTMSGNESTSAMLGGNAVELTYADGAMTYAVSFGETSIEFKCVILEDGMLGFTMGMGEELAMGMYFTKNAAEEQPAA